MSKTHARFSPSSLDALSKCIRFKYKERDDDSGEEGTEMHAGYETENLNGLDTEQKGAVQQVIDYTNSLLATEGGPECWDVIKECKVVLADLTYGHPDRALVHKTKPILHVLDAKFTRVEGHHTFQLRVYGAAIVEMLLPSKGAKLFNEPGDPTLYSSIDTPTGGCLTCRPIERVITHIVAPRLGDIHIEEFNAQALLTSVRKEIEDLYEKIDNPFNPPTPHEDICKNCARASVCPAIGVTAVAVSRGIGLPVPTAFAADALVDVKDRARAQVLAGALENWSEQIKKQNTEFVRQGGEIPGFKFVKRSTGVRIPQDRTEEAIVLLREAGWDDSEILQACTLSIAKLAEARAQITAGAKPADVKEELAPILAGVTSEGSAEFLQKTKRTDDVKLLEQINSGEVK